MNELHTKLLEMYDKLNNKFLENNVRFFAIGGTAISAIREKGFIPGDDDMDFCVFEEDLDAFRKAVVEAGMVFKIGLDKQLQYFIKIYDPEVVITTKGSEHHLFIDFMIAQKRRKWSKRRLAIYTFFDVVAISKRRNFKEFCLAEGKTIAVFYKIAKFFFTVFPERYVEKKMIDILLNAPLEENELNKDLLGSYHGRRDEYYNVKEIKYIPFEETVIPVNISFPEDVLHTHGDIMARPPENERFNHDVVIKKEA